jgi:hypothetical protein
MYRKLDESKNIINYLKFQRIPFNKQLPKILETYVFDKKKFNNLKKNERDLITEDIKDQILLFSDVGEKYNINYLNYILIIESLPQQKMKNLYRYFSLRWNFLLNTDENLKSEKDNLKFKYKYSDVYTSSNPKKKLLVTLNDLKTKKNITIIYFIGCLNQFTT